MNTDDIIEVLDKLVGNINPVGMSHVDEVHSENLKTYLQIFDEMHTKIDAIAYDNKDRKEHSIVEMVKLCNNQLATST